MILSSVLLLLFWIPSSALANKPPTPSQQMQLQNLDHQLVAAQDNLDKLERNIRYLEEELIFIDDQKFRKVLGAAVGYSFGFTSLYWGINSIALLTNSKENYVTETGLDTPTVSNSEVYDKTLRQTVVRTVVPVTLGLLVGASQHAALNAAIEREVDYRQKLQIALLEKSKIEQNLRRLQDEKQDLMR